MRKNQKYSQKEMYATIERCRKENIPYAKFCRQSCISYATLKYWIDKYEEEKLKANQSVGRATFVPVHVPEASLNSNENPENILVAYTNGTKISCPTSIPQDLLRTIIKP